MQVSWGKSVAIFIASAIILTIILFVGKNSMNLEIENKRKSDYNSDDIQRKPDMIDIVYTWVNGSDERHETRLNYWKFKANDMSEEEFLKEKKKEEPSSDIISANRFRDNDELRYSLRSLEKFARNHDGKYWIRKIFIVTNGQIPNWLNLNHPMIKLVTHEDIFKGNAKNHLPTFSSPSIESHLHEIEGLSDWFLYLNDDVMFGNTVNIEDFITDTKGQKVFLSWDIPECSPGCHANWIGDGYCDMACNTTLCDYDGGDCLKQSSSFSSSSESSSSSSWKNFDWYKNWESKTSEKKQENKLCSFGCEDYMIGNGMCNVFCNVEECGFDGGDCGVGLATQKLPILNVEKTKTMLKKKKEKSYYSLDTVVSNDATSLVLNISSFFVGKFDKDFNYFITNGFHDSSDKILASTVKSKDKMLILTFRNPESVNNGTIFDFSNFEDVFFLSFLVFSKCFFDKILEIICKTMTNDMKKRRLNATIPLFRAKQAELTIEAEWRPKKNVSEDEKSTKTEIPKEKIKISLDFLPSKFFLPQMHMKNQKIYHKIDYIQEVIAYFDSIKKIKDSIKNQKSNEDSEKNEEKTLKKEEKDQNPEKTEEKFQNTGKQDETKPKEEEEKPQISKKSDSFMEKNKKKKQKFMKVPKSSTLSNSDKAMDKQLETMKKTEEIHSFFDTAKEEEDSQPKESHFNPLSSAKSRKLMDKFGDSLVFVNKLFNQAFGIPKVTRRVPAHMPFLMNKRILEEIHRRWPKQFDNTSASRFRSSKDMQFAFTYFYFVMSEITQKYANATDFFKKEIASNKEFLSPLDIRLIANVLLKKKVSLFEDKKLLEDSIELGKKLIQSCENSKTLNQQKCSITDFEKSLNSTFQVFKAKYTSENDLLASSSTSGYANYSWKKYSWSKDTTSSSAKDGNSSSSAWTNVFNEEKPKDLKEEIIDFYSNSISGSEASEKYKIRLLYKIIQTVLDFTQNLLNPSPNSSKTKTQKAYSFEIVQISGLSELFNQYLNSTKESLYTANKFKFELTPLDDVAFEMVKNDPLHISKQLDDIRMKKPKFICLNDNMNSTEANNYQKTQKRLREFYEWYFDNPSQFELPKGVHNRMLYFDDLMIDQQKDTKFSIFANILNTISIFLVLAILWCIASKEEKECAIRSYKNFFFWVKSYVKISSSASNPSNQNLNLNLNLISFKAKAESDDEAQSPFKAKAESDDEAQSPFKTV